MKVDIKSQWFSLASKYTKDDFLINSLWLEISKHYSEKNRYYHTLSHIQNMLHQAKNFEDKIIDFDALLFAIWYHDIIYKSTKKDNEVQSAHFAKTSLENFNVDIEKIQNLIISTKNHTAILDNNLDNAYLLDFDLSILGSDWEIYKNYTHQIRKEYKIYPNFMYRSGRKKVLRHFLERETLYFTETYQITHENRARQNLEKELEML